MSAPLVWGLGPLLAGLALVFVRRRARLVAGVGAGAALLLAAFVWVFPIGQAVRLGPWSFRLADTLPVLGRRFVMADAERGIVALIFAAAGLWFLGAWFARPGVWFVPLGMVNVVLLTAALSVEPFLYAALFHVMTVVVSVPFLCPPGQAAGRGVLRYLVFQSLGAPFILLTGWFLGRVDPALAGPEQLVFPAVMVGFGFAFLMAVFPFHTWLPMLAEEAHPYAAGFVFLLLPGVVSLFGLGFLNEYAWLRDSPAAISLLQGVGFWTTMAGGVWAAFDFSRRRGFSRRGGQYLGRLLGFAAVVETGVALLVIGAGDREGVRLFFALWPPRLLGFFVWAQALAFLQREAGTLDLWLLRGVGRRLPLGTLALAGAIFSVSGFPLLAGFPVRMAVVEHLAATNSVAVWGVLTGGVGLMAAGLRALAVMTAPPGEGTAPVVEGGQEPVRWKAFFVVCLAGLALAGGFPQWLFPWLERLPLAFGALWP